MLNRSTLDTLRFKGRTALDAGWTTRRKTIVGIAAGCLALGAAGTGYWAWSAMTPPPLPRTVDEAMAVMASDRFDRLDPERRRAYATEASRLLREVPPEERRATFRDLPEEHREGLRVLMAERMDDMARRIARGELDPNDPDFWREMWGGRGGERRERGEGDGGRPRGGEGGGRRGGWGGGGDWQSRVSDRISQQVQSGSAQRTGLRTEMFRAMREARGGARGPGGGRRGSGGGGG